MIGFTNAGGSGLALSVIGGQDRPETALENTIWIQTDSQIDSYILSAEDPGEKPDGTVWIKTGDSANEFIDLLQTDSIIIGLLRGYVRAANKWVAKSSSVFLNGAWQILAAARFLIKGGIMQENFLVSGYNAPKGLLKDGPPQVTFTASGNGVSQRMYVAAPIDVTEFENIKVSVQDNTYGAMYLKLWSEEPTGPSIGSGATQAPVLRAKQLNPSPATTSPLTEVLNIADINREAWIGIERSSRENVSGKAINLTEFKLIPPGGEEA